MTAIAKPKVKTGHPLKWFRPKRVVKVRDKMQRTSYVLTAPVNADFDPLFKPQLTPADMLALGVFEGKYLNDCRAELPQEWFTRAKLSLVADPSINHFGVKSRMSLQHWQRKGWIIGDDPRGWFQWYCRYFLGRRTEHDARQIARWRAFERHRAQVVASAARAAEPPRTLPQKRRHRPRQRQALLQWAYNPYC